MTYDPVTSFQKNLYFILEADLSHFRAGLLQFGNPIYGFWGLHWNLWASSYRQEIQASARKFREKFADKR